MENYQKVRDTNVINNYRDISNFYFNIITKSNKKTSNQNLPTTIINFTILPSVNIITKPKAVIIEKKKETDREINFARQMTDFYIFKNKNELKITNNCFCILQEGGKLGGNKDKDKDRIIKDIVLSVSNESFQYQSKVSKEIKVNKEIDKVHKTNTESQTLSNNNV